MKQDDVVARRCRLERRLAEAALERYGLQDARLELLRQHFVQVFRVVCREGEFVLKLYDVPRSVGGGLSSGRARTKYLSMEVLRSQLLWLSALGRETDLLVPEPALTNDGSLLGYISSEDLSPRHPRPRSVSGRRDAEDLHRDLEGLPRMSRTFALVRWVPGGHKESEDLQPEDASLLGSYMARLHRHAEGYGVPEGSAFPRWDWESTFGEAAQLWRTGPAFYSASEMETFRAIARHVREHLEALGYDRDVFHIIHGDIKLDNFVFRTGTVAAIDFEASGRGHSLFDLSRMYNSFRRGHRNHLDPLWSVFLESYRRERPLPEGYERYLNTFNVMQRVTAVNNRLAYLSRRGTPLQSQQPSLPANVAGWLKSLSSPAVRRVHPRRRPGSRPR